MLIGCLQLENATFLALSIENVQFGNVRCVAVDREQLVGFDDVVADAPDVFGWWNTANGDLKDGGLASLQGESFHGITINPWLHLFRSNLVEVGRVAGLAKSALVLGTNAELNCVTFLKTINLSLDLLLLPLLLLGLGIVFLISLDRLDRRPLTGFRVALFNDVFVDRSTAVIVWRLELEIDGVFVKVDNFRLVTS